MLTPESIIEEVARIECALENQPPENHEDENELKREKGAYLLELELMVGANEASKLLSESRKVLT